MIGWLLRCLDANPGRVFYETELREKDELAFEALRAESLLRALPNLKVGDSYDWQTNGRLLTIVEGGARPGVEAIDLDDPDLLPVRLSAEQLRLWEVDDTKLIERFRDASELTGKGEPLSRGLYLLGERESGGETAACCLALVGNSELVAALAPVCSLLGPAYSSFVVGCFQTPTRSQSRRLEAMGIRVSVLDERQPLMMREMALAGGLFFDHDLIRNHDYTQVRWRGQNFTFTTVQARVVQLLHEAHKGGQAPISGSSLMVVLQQTGLSTASDLRDVMRRSMAWMTLIVSARRGYYRLGLP